jgi:hypothetical protein
MRIQGATTDIVAHLIGGISLMQSILIFIADLQMAKRRFLEKFESSDDHRFSLEHNEDGLGHQELMLLKARKGYSTYETRETTSHGVLPDTLRRNQDRIE